MFSSSDRGQSLFELVLAVALFALLAASLTPLVLNGYQLAMATDGEALVRRYAWSGLEAARAIAARAWNELNLQTSDPVWAGGQWSFAGEGAIGTDGVLERRLVFSPVCRTMDGAIAACPANWLDPHARQVTAVVNWRSAAGESREFRLPFYLSNWDSLDWETTDWSGGSGQGLWLDPTRYDSDDGQVESVPGGLRLRQTTTADGSLNQNFDTVSGWSFSPWGVGPGEVTPTGQWQASGGHPGGTVQINIPFNARDDQVGAYWQRPVRLTEDNLPLICSTEWRVTDWVAGNRRADDFRILMFLDAVSGPPALGSEIWSSNQLRGNTGWLSTGAVDCAAVAPAAGMYFLKIGIWLDAAAVNTGPITVLFDNAGVNWGRSTYALRGELTSSAFNLGGPSPLQVVEWEADDACSPNCSITVNVRTAPDSGGVPGVWGEWVGAQGSGSDFTLASGSLVPISENGRVWAQYRVRLAGDGSVSPVLQALRLNFR